MRKTAHTEPEHVPSSLFVFGVWESQWKMHPGISSQLKLIIGGFQQQKSYITMEIQ